LILLTFAGAAHAGGKSPLPKSEVLKAVRAKNVAAGPISEVLADVGGGRYPVLFWQKGRDCLTRTIEGEIEKHCSATAEPHVAIVKRGEGGALSVEADLALPTAETPWDLDEPPKWGVTLVKDWDGDGKPELLVIYGYNGPMVWAVGNVAYRSLAIVNLADALSLSVAVVLDQHPQASVKDVVESSWRVLPGSDGKPTLQLKVTEAAYDDAKGERVPRSSTVLYRWDAASDRFVKPSP
jgi:hypothetical protein